MDYSNLKYFALWIGHGRSGHSLTGSLLDAHRNIIVSHEYFVLQHLPEHRKAETFYDAICALSEEQAKTGRYKKASVYKYNINTPWQGKSDNLKVIGDKCGGNVSLTLRSAPWLFDQLQIMIEPLEFRVYHIVRNPFDNIATLALRNNWPLENTINYYLQDEVSVEKVMSVGLNILTMKLEDLIAEPEKNLTALVNHVGQEPDKQWMKACKKLVFNKPSITRHKVEWQPQQIELIQNHINKTEYLKGYKFED